MHVSSGRPSMLMSNQRGRGNEPVVVLGRIRSAVAVNISASSQKLQFDWVSNFVGFRFSVVQFSIGGQATLRGFHFRILATFLLDQVVFDACFTLRRREQLFPGTHTFSK